MLINLVDIFMALIIVRFMIKGMANKFFSELFALIFVFISAIITAHYFYRFGAFLGEKMLLSPDNRELVAYYILALGTYLIYPLVREGWVIMLKFEFEAEVNAWVQALITGLKTYLIAGIIFMGLIVTQMPQVVNHANRSISNILFREVVGAVYFWAYYGPIQWLTANEPRNIRLYELIENKKDLKIKSDEEKDESVKGEPAAMTH